MQHLEVVGCKESKISSAIKQSFLAESNQRLELVNPNKQQIARKIKYHPRSTPAQKLTPDDEAFAQGIEDAEKSHELFCLVHSNRGVICTFYSTRFS